MKVKWIEEQKNGFAQYLRSNKDQLHLYRLCVKKWQENFDLEEMRLGPTIKTALKNPVSGRLWYGEKNSIKSGLILLAESQADLFWTSIKDLFNEDLSLDGRVNRFLYHCDVILQEIRKKDDKQNAHYQSLYSASMLLSFQFPDKYCLYNYGVFSEYCRKIGVLEIPIQGDIERYFKIINANYNVIQKDQEFMNLYFSTIPEDRYLGISKDIVYDIMEWSVRK